MVDDQKIMARSFGHCLDLLELMLNRQFDFTDAGDLARAKMAVQNFRRLLNRSNAAHVVVTQ